MQSNLDRRKPAFAVCIFTILIVNQAFAGVSRAIQDKYRRSYENKALFLRIPVFSDRQYIFLRGRTVSPDQGLNTGTARYRVGDQVRVLGIDFGGDEIKFKLGAISGTGLAEIVFKFDSNLLDNFPNSDVFDSALQTTFTEGLKYSDLDEAKRDYIVDQFERAVREIVTTTGSSRELVLKNMAPRLPSYQDAVRDVENLKNRNQDLSSQIAQIHSDNRRLEADLNAQQAEVTRLRSANAALQEKIDGSTSQLSRLGEDLRNARAMTQGYQKELANLQRSLNLKVDANRDLALQIADLGQAMRKIQKDYENLENQSGSLRTDIEKLQSANALLSGEVEDAKASNQKMRETIDILTSKEDSLARQYLDLKRKKENLDNIILAIDNLDVRTVEDRTQGGYSTGLASLYLRDILLGSLEWRFPEHLSRAEQQTGQVSFSTESIDYVRVTPEERHILRSFGDRLKLQVKLAPLSPTIEVKPDKDEALQEIGERDRARWRWHIYNGGTQDTRLALAVNLINKNADTISVFQREQLIRSSSIVRQARNYLQPIPIALGTVLGFLLFGIVGIFRRVKSPEATRRTRATSAPDASVYKEQKRL